MFLEPKGSEDTGKKKNPYFILNVSKGRLCPGCNLHHRMIIHLHYKRKISAQDIFSSRLPRVKSLLCWLIYFHSNYFWYSCMHSHTLCKRWCFVMPSHLLKKVVMTLRWNWLMPGFNALSPSVVPLNMRKFALQNMAETTTFSRVYILYKNILKSTC